jgi:cytochrome c
MGNRQALRLLLSLCAILACSTACTRHGKGTLAGGDDGTAAIGPDGGPDDPGVAEDDDDGVGLCPPILEVDLPDAAVVASTPPPPVSGGTLLVTRDGTKAIAADPDRDAIEIVDLDSYTLAATVALRAGDEPGRLIEDGTGAIHVALRRGGAVVTIDPAAGAVTARQPVCPAPRGIAWQASTDTIWVACATGELASLPAAGGVVTTRHLERDLRDVLIDGDGLAVTEFKSAQILRVTTDGAIVRRDPMPIGSGAGVAAHVAWRSVAGPNGTIVASYQGHTKAPLSTQPGGYGCSGGGLRDIVKPLDAGLASGDGGTNPSAGGGSTSAAVAGDGGIASIPKASFVNVGSVVVAVVSVIGPDGTLVTQELLPSVLPVDVAVSPDGTRIGSIAAGGGLTALTIFQAGLPAGVIDQALIDGMPTAVAFAGDRVLVQTREPAALWVGDAKDISDTDLVTKVATVTLATDSRDDTGHDIFHFRAGTNLACASCHPEGGDDGHTWVLDGLSRRTPSLRGTVAGTAPYHWSGDEADMNAIIQDVYVGRMSGPQLDTSQAAALEHWVDGIPAPPAPSWVDADAAAAGKTIFERTDVGCTTCHSGPKMTNDTTVDVGTGGAFQVPPLVGVGWNAPLMHGGCAATIADRFGACSTPAHGDLTSLSTTDVADLTAYLETL